VPPGAQLRPRVGPKKERIRPITARLEAAHPDAKIALRYRNEVELLVAVMHSAQTDVKVNRVTEALVEKYRRPRTSSPDVVASVAVVLL
jgi:endonuclease III